MSEQKGTRDHSTANSPMNALSFLIETQVKGMVSVAIPVRVDEVDTDALKLSCTPLVTQLDARSNALEPTKIFEVPYTRLQGGIAAIIIDPVVGDIGIAVFAHQDISNVQGNTPVQPGSFRSYDQADGMYIGGILNKTPEIWLELTQEGVATLHAPTKIILEAPEIELNAETSITLDTPIVYITGSISQTGEKGNVSSFNGSIHAQDDITSDTNVVGGGISLNSHTHSGVQTGGDSTGGPQ